MSTNTIVPENSSNPEAAAQVEYFIAFYLDARR
jgi:hypothetical protein